MCYKCNRSEKRLEEKFLDMFTSQQCQIRICQECYQKNIVCYLCEETLKAHQLKNQWIRYFQKQVQLRKQLQDKFLLEDRYFTSTFQKQSYINLLQCLIDCRKRKKQRKELQQIEKKIYTAIQDFVRKKRQTVNIVTEQTIYKHKQQNPSFIRKIQNPVQMCQSASGYSQQQCYQRGIMEIIKAFQK